MSKSAPTSPLIYQLLSIVGGLAIWFVAAKLTASPLLPGPVQVVGFIREAMISGEMPYHMAMTLGRVAASFVIAMALGLAIGLAMGQSQLTDRIGDPWLIFFLNTPALVIIIMAYVWFGLTEAAAIGAVALNKIPNVAVTVREGARTLDPHLDDLARIYRLSKIERLRQVVLPQLQPFFAAAARSGISLIWKIVLVVELLGRSNGVGFQLYLYFQLFDVTAILGYTLVFVALMIAIEVFMVQPYERYATRWRIRSA